MRIKFCKCLLLLALALILHVKIVAQTIEMSYKDNSSYLRFTKRGVTKNGLQVGKWQNVNANNIIYKEYYFNDDGQPTGIWKINFPDGKIRKEIEYVDSKLVRMTRFSRNSDRQFEIITLEGLNDSTYMKIEIHEEEIFISEGKESKWEMKDERGHVTSSREWQYDYYGGMDGLIKILINNKFTGTLDIWRINKDHFKKCTFKEGRYFTTLDSFKNGILISQEEFNEEGKKVKSTKFDENGIVIKSKTYMN
jgi:antitoxin component YwqK of YwqJK toxin-antitoxin module